jgi:hypothetical protein
MQHRIRRDGQPVPVEAIERRKQRVRAALAKTPSHGWHSPEARRKGKISKIARTEAEKRLKGEATRSTTITGHYATLAARGVFRCPECMSSAHKRVDFSSPTELGKHRRFKHGVLGRNHLKAQVALERRHEQRIDQRTNGLAVNSNVVVDSNGRLQCPQCPNTFKALNFLTAHLKRMHQVDPSELQILPTPKQELIHANGSTKRTAENHTVNGERRGHSDDASYVTAIAVANLTGKLQGIILTASDEYDIPPRQLARRCILALSEHYST